MSKVLIIDSSYLVFRSFFGYPHLNTGDKPTGAFYGYCKTILNLVHEYHPKYLYIARDLPTPTWRHQEFADYKAGRAVPDPQMLAQFPIINQWSDLIASQTLSQSGFEADDIIATLSHQFQSDEEIQEILIFSADKDLYQLFTNTKVRFYQNDSLFTRDNFVNKYNLEPHQWVEYKALVGDSSDNIKGVDGIGPKTATTILTELQNLHNLISSTSHPWIQNPKNQKIIQKLHSNRERLQNNIRLCTLSNIPDLQVQKQGYNLQNGLNLLQEYQFKSLAKQLQPQVNLNLHPTSQLTAVSLF
jgi:DNA polymerase I